MKAGAAAVRSRLERPSRPLRGASGRGHTRTIAKGLLDTGATPKIEIDAETYAVTADGELLVCEPADRLPMAQRYFLF